MTTEVAEDTLPDVGMMPSVEEPAPIVDEPKMTAAEVINPEEMISVADVWCRLGINENTLVNFLNGQSAGKSHYFTQVRGSGGGYTQQVLGRQLLRWIDGERIAYDVDTLLAANIRRDRARKAAAAAEDAAAKAAKAPRPGNLLDELAKIQKDQHSQQREFDESNAAAYVAIILREWPNPTDAGILASMIEDGFVTREQIVRDQETAKRAIEFQGWHEHAAGTNQQRIELAEQHLALEAKCKADLAASSKQLRHAEALYYQYSQAGYELDRLARSRPELFDTSTTPPKLRRPEPATVTEAFEPEVTREEPAR